MVTWQSKEWWKYFSNRRSMWWMICNYIRWQCWTLDKWAYYWCNCPSTFLHGNTIILHYYNISCCTMLHLCLCNSTFIIFHSCSELNVFSMVFLCKPTLWESKSSQPLIFVEYWGVLVTFYYSSENWNVWI